jgi:hypothetical protein
MLHNAALWRGRVCRNTIVPTSARDAQSIWFPEMIERLRVQRDEGMPCDVLVKLRDVLDAKLQWIRSERHGDITGQTLFVDGDRANGMI